ncbi:TPA: DUF2290 domain-containing protein [Burkholderia vietnamiensis]|nr:DUF2290 domain-containing protein [Burkholderia vietnamiensis]
MVPTRRFPVTGGLTPRWFAEFVLRNVYQTGKHDFLSGLPVHRIGFESTITNSKRELMHVVVLAQ